MLEALFSPRSVAIVGAAREEGKLGHAVLRNVLESGYSGRVYPVNPKAEQILGLKCYPSVLDIPDEIDMVVVVVPRAVAVSVMREAARKQVKVAVIITAGFREVGGEGLEAEQEIKRIAAQAGMRVLGPNVLGVMDTHTPLNATFAARMPARGEIALMSQSGALLAAILDWAALEKVGFSKVVSLGNKADIDEVDLMEAWRTDEHSRVIVAYLEGIEDGRQFMQMASCLTKEKPMIAIKSGITAAGARAVSSHTGTLAGSQAAYDAVFKQSGVIRADSVEHLFDLSLAFAYQPLPRGRRLAVVTNAGGPGIMATDAAERAGLELASFLPGTIAKLREQLPPAAGVFNPIDVLGDARADRYAIALQVALDDPGVDGVLVLLTPQAMTEIEETARVVVEASQRTDKPVFASFMGGVDVSRGVEVLKAGRVPNYPFPERAVAAFRAMNDYREWAGRPLEEPIRLTVDRERARAIIERARQDGRTILTDIEARELIGAYGIRSPRSVLARSAAEAVAAAEAIGYPVVLKIASPDIVHKSDIGGVRINLRSADEVRTAYTAIREAARRHAPRAAIWGMTVQEMLRPGREVILGLTSDPQFGHLLMFGLGGIYVEVLRDVAFRVVPVTPTGAREMLREIRSYPLLTGVRGQPPADLEAIIDGLLRLSQLATDFPEIAELDVNPLMVYPMGEGAVAVDARAALSGGEVQTARRRPAA